MFPKTIDEAIAYFQDKRACHERIRRIRSRAGHKFSSRNPLSGTILKPSVASVQKWLVLRQALVLGSLGQIQAMFLGCKKTGTQILKLDAALVVAWFLFEKKRIALAILSESLRLRDTTVRKMVRAFRDARASRDVPRCA